MTISRDPKGQNEAQMIRSHYTPVYDKLSLQCHDMLSTLSFRRVSVGRVSVELPAEMWAGNLQ